MEVEETEEWTCLDALGTQITIRLSNRADDELALIEADEDGSSYMFLSFDTARALAHRILAMTGALWR